MNRPRREYTTYMHITWIQAFFPFSLSSSSLLLLPPSLFLIHTHTRAESLPQEDAACLLINVKEIYAPDRLIGMI